MASRPGGDSYGTLVVDGAGRVNFSASLADGTKITQSGGVSRYGQWPLYVPLYRGQGSIFSWMNFTNSATADLSGDLVWYKPASSAKYYGAGFNYEDLARGSKYNRLASAGFGLGLADAYVVLEGGELAQSITNHVSIGANNRVTNLSSNKLSLSFTTSSGAFKGTVVDPATLKRIQFSGVVLQDRGSGTGLFLGTSQSGRVSLRAKP